MWKVLVLGKIHEAGIEKLYQAGDMEIVQLPDNPPGLDAIVSGCDGVIVRTTPIDRKLINAAVRLKIVARHGVGYDAVDVQALSEREIPLAVTGDVNSTAVAEHTLALILDVSKNVTAFDKKIRIGEFSVRDRFSALELNGRTALIIGFGRIGRKVAALCRAFDMNVLIYDPYIDEGMAERHGTRRVSSWREALTDADVVTIHAPKSAQTEHLFGVAEFRRMKKGSILINVARGGMVDEAALADALDEGRLAGAALDVFEREPPLPTSRLIQHEAVVLSPHSAAFTQECVQRMSVACANNIVSFRDGRIDPELVVNRNVLKLNQKAK